MHIDQGGCCRVGIESLHCGVQPTAHQKVCQNLFFDAATQFQTSHSMCVFGSVSKAMETMRKPNPQSTALCEPSIGFLAISDTEEGQRNCARVALCASAFETEEC